MTSPPVLGIVADDLTGGAAVAGEIARGAGPEVEVVRMGHREPTGGGSVVVETGSRYIDAELAAAGVVRARRLLRDRGVDVTMKKIDSTLKGNVATELAAFVSDTDGRVIVAPACPAVSLGLRGGRQYRGEEPGRDVAELLAAVLDEPPVLLPLDVVRHGVDAVATWLEARDARVVLADSMTQADLDAVVGGSCAVGVVDYAGTYGLGTAFRRGEQQVNRAALPSAERLLVLAGSANPVSATQVRRLVDEGADEVVVDIRVLLAGSRDERARVRSAVAASRSVTVVVHTDPGVTGTSVTAYRREAGWSERDLAEHLADPFVDALEALPDAAVYLIGGETTGAICDRIGWHRFVVTGEVSVAVPLAAEETATRPFVLTKPGAFGARDDLLVAARRVLHGAPSTAY